MSYKNNKKELLKRRVGEETSRTYEDKIDNGFFDKYMSGETVEIGADGYIDSVGVLPNTKVINLNTPGYDGLHLPFGDSTQDAVYSSHVLEHIDNRIETLREWMRVIKIGGHLIIAVPHQFLYEKKLNKPSRYNGDHRVFYSPATLLAEIEQAFEPNSYRVRVLEDGDKGYNYSIPPEQHAWGQYEILLVLEKINKPTWNIE